MATVCQKVISAHPERILRLTFGLLPRSEPYTRRLETILLLFIVTYAIKQLLNTCPLYTHVTPIL